MSDIEMVYERKQNVLVCVSEGVKTADGKIIPELLGEVSVDAFGHKQMGGAAAVLANYVRNRLNTKVRGIEFSLMQRCAAHLASGVDVEEAFRAGQEAVRAAVAGVTDVMIGFSRPAEGDYECEYIYVPLAQVANAEKTVPLEWISEAGNQILPPFIEYVMPLIQGENEMVYVDGLPRFANLKKVLVQV